MKIALLGDIGFLGDYSISNNPQLKDNLSEVKCFLEQFDLVVGNLETPFSVKQKPWGAKSAYLCADLQNVDILKYLHVDIVSIANNHMFDFGIEGFNTTIKLLEENQIQWFGANGKSVEIIQDKNRIKFNGFCCYSTNSLKIAKKYGDFGLNRFCLPEVINLLKDNHKEGWFNIFAIHSGIEHVNNPSLEQIYSSRELSKNAPYVWYGHHPHVIQGIEKINDSVIAHSLGNFCFAENKEDATNPVIELTDDNRRGMILCLQIEHNKIINNSIVLTHIGKNGNLRLLNDASSLDEYSKNIKSCDIDPVSYKMQRVAQRGIYLARRSEMRNFKWVIKRLRPRYAKLLVENKLNSKRYFANVCKPLIDLGYKL